MSLRSVIVAIGIILSYQVSAKEGNAIQVRGNLFFGQVPAGKSEQRLIQICSGTAFTLDSYYLSDQSYNGNYHLKTEMLAAVQQEPSLTFCKALSITFIPDSDQSEAMKLYGRKWDDDGFYVSEPDQDMEPGEVASDSKVYLIVETSLGQVKMRIRGIGVSKSAWNEIAYHGWRYSGYALDTDSHLKLLDIHAGYSVILDTSKNRLELYRIENNGMFSLKDAHYVSPDAFSDDFTQSYGDDREVLLLGDGDRLTQVFHQADKLVVNELTAIPAESRKSGYKSGSAFIGSRIALSYSGRCLLADGVTYSRGADRTLIKTGEYTDSKEKRVYGPILTSQGHVILSYGYFNYSKAANFIRELAGYGRSIEACELNESNCRISHCQQLASSAYVNGFSANREGTELALMTCSVWGCELQIRELNQSYEQLFSYSSSDDFPGVSQLIYMPEMGGILGYGSTLNRKFDYPYGSFQWLTLHKSRQSNPLETITFSHDSRWKINMPLMNTREGHMARKGRFFYIPAWGKLEFFERLTVFDPEYGALPEGLFDTGAL